MWICALLVRFVSSFSSCAYYIINNKKLQGAARPCPFPSPPFIQKFRAVRKGSPRRSAFLEKNSRRGAGGSILLCERLQGPFVPSGVVTSSGPAKSSQDDAQRTRRPFQLPACSSPVRRRFGFFFRSGSFLPSRKYWTRKYWQGLQVVLYRVFF